MVAKKPVEMHILQGTRYKDKNLPKPKKIKAKHLRVPPNLNDESKKFFRNYARKLEILGLLSEIDIPMFTRYCDIYGKWIVAKQWIDQHGSTYPIYEEQTEEEIDTNAPKRLKKIMTFPQVGIYERLNSQLVKIETQFGMSPAARTGLDVKVQDSKASVKQKLFG